VQLKCVKTKYYFTQTFAHSRVGNSRCTFRSLLGFDLGLVQYICNRPFLFSKNLLLSACLAKPYLWLLMSVFVSFKFFPIQEFMSVFLLRDNQSIMLFHLFYIRVGDLRWFIFVRILRFICPKSPKGAPAIAHSRVGKSLGEIVFGFHTFQLH